MAEGTIVVCDALCAVADALAAHLRGEGLEVVATVSGSEELLAAVAEHRPEVVLVDVAVFRSHPGRLLRALARVGDAKVLILGPATAVDEAAEAVQDGVQGWILADASSAEMVKAVRGALVGEYWMPMELMAAVLRSYTIADLRGEGQEGADSDTRVAALGVREKLVLECLVEGLDRRAIAKRMAVSEHTVRTHVRRILKKLDAHSMLEAAAIARQAGLGGGT
ncbi:LuxR C-terminal-related transcriptional regulator [Catenulispora rubra]|uniref:LuxR C-terminal-related transcriptional regulator n=1 Tax=Catenulispora rubra TaxID=280293 RepID=UPI001891FAEA|nr:response regulator transcription factor [Catenulispora rubra]